MRVCACAHACVCVCVHKWVYAFIAVADRLCIIGHSEDFADYPAFSGASCAARSDGSIAAVFWYSAGARAAEQVRVA